MKILLKTMLPALCAALCVFAFTACERESTAGTIRLDTLNLATHRTMKPVVHFMDSIRMKARLKAAWGEVFDTRQETQLGGGIRVEFLSKFTGEVVSVLTADSALIDDKTKNMTARGNVVVVSDYPARTVRTTLMMWDNARQKLHSSEFVSVTSPEETLQGYGFEADQNLDNYTIYNVSGQMMTLPIMLDETGTTGATTATVNAPQTTVPQITTPRTNAPILTTRPTVNVPAPPAIK